MLQWYSQRKFSVLLSALVALIVLQSFIEHFPFHLFFVHLGYSMVLIATILAFGQDPRLQRLLILLGALAMVGTWSVYFLQGDDRREVIIADRLVAVVFLGITTWVVLERVVTEVNVTVDTLMGSVCVYLLIGATWGVGYSALFYIDPNSFTIADNIEATMEANYISINQWLYYSFMTLTTLGYSNISPASRGAGTLTWLEAMAGQFYMAVLVARLVGLHTIPTSSSSAK